MGLYADQPSHSDISDGTKITPVPASGPQTAVPWVALADNARLQSDDLP